MVRLLVGVLEMKKLIRKGKVKEVYQIAPNRLEFHFTDNISIFDKVVPREVPRKGESLCKTASFWFEKVEKLGFKTHYLQMTDDDKMEVEKFDVFDDYKELDESFKNYRIPLEFFTRYYVTYSLLKRIADGGIDYNDLGLDGKPELGDKLPEPFFEVTAKLDGKKEVLDKEEALQLAGLSEEELEEIRKRVLKIDQMIHETIQGNNLLHAEGSKEFAMNDEGEIVLVDSFGTADEDVFWEADEYEEGNLVQKNEEIVYDYYEETGYLEELEEAKKFEEKEPPIPSLPDELIEKTSEVYIDMMKRLTNRK